eukprot:3574087-Rhodomonas_salina.2
MATGNKQLEEHGCSGSQRQSSARTPPWWIWGGSARTSHTNTLQVTFLSITPTKTTYPVARTGNGCCPRAQASRNRGRSCGQMDPGKIWAEILACVLVTGATAPSLPSIFADWTDLPLTILTDCLSALYVFQQWKQRDFRPSAEDELHWDILSDILQMLRSRTRKTVFVWVKGHLGNPGNTAADRMANAGCTADDEDVIYHHVTAPMAFFSRET